MEIPNFLNGEAIFNSIKANSKKRRESPIDFFQEFLDDIWMDNNYEEAVVQWKVKVEHFPWYADDALYCMDAVIADPPTNLVPMLENKGWIVLFHEIDESGNEAAYTYREYLEWLKEMRDDFKTIYNCAP